MFAHPIDFAAHRGIRDASQLNTNQRDNARLDTEPLDTKQPHTVQLNSVRYGSDYPEKPVVYLVDDKPDQLDASVDLIEALQMEPRPFRSPSEFLAAHDPSVPGCVVIDLLMPEMSGLELQRQLIAQPYVRPHFLVSGHADVAMAVESMAQGAAGFLVKPYRIHEFVEHVQAAVQQDFAWREREQRRSGVKVRLESLTDRERQVLGLILEGEPNKRIAKILTISPRTVELHRSHVMKKLKAPSLAHLIRSVLMADPCLYSAS